MKLLILQLLAAVTSAFELVILHTNDVHARIDQTNKYGAVCSDRDLQGEDGCFGGVARRKTAIERVRASHDNVLLLDAGDQFQGTTWFSFYEGTATAHFMNLLGYDAMALGNHEFDYGVDTLQAFLDNVSFPILSSNIRLIDGGGIPGGIQSSVLLEVGDQKVGVIGYITPDTKNMVDPNGIDTIRFTDALDAVQREVDKFSNLAVGQIDIIIVLGHGGYSFDQFLAKNVKGVDLVIGGHSHSMLWTGEPPSNNDPIGKYPTIVTQSNGRRVPVVQAYAYGKYLGKLQLDFDDNGELVSWSGLPILLDSSIPEDPEIIKETLGWSTPLNEFKSKVTGVSYVDLEGDRYQCRMRECNMGNLICDAIVKENVRTGAPDQGQWATSAIGLWNGGGIRSSIEQGLITRAQVMEVLPFRNEVSRVLLLGSTLLKLLENSVSGYDITGKDPRGRFLQVSGLRVAYNLSSPVGLRVESVQALCSNCKIPVFLELEPHLNYSVLTNHFIVNGGDGYSMIKEEMLSIEPLGYLGSDTLEAYLDVESPVIKGLDNRITFVGNGSYIAPAPLHGHCTVCTTCKESTTLTTNTCTNQGTIEAYSIGLFVLVLVLGVIW
ncbi:hypothetical protein CAPTEDRAFT_152432 [Capitella teleta]|uniref:5'-nucleotidase n=1 Tax=Capitella teleta TaxID=283909 RepID=R7UV88_CAPTE|nr:hypothetical protein CAPTEDRAFT_152432 [Capitella teleta]|eukprot:ELU10065.1 hypothetical protein CAPTEDRAFT_152432 [Capitella teleta]